MKTLHFRVSIKAPKVKVWDAMLESETYKVWTEAFTEGSYYEGSWEKGGKIRFLAPDGQGMTSEIAENKKYEFISIKHLGYIKNGIEDTQSPGVRTWAPAYENYTFHEEGGITEVEVEVDVTEDFEKMFEETWPKALERLKGMVEKI